jgi:hypothetical protein
MTSIDVSIVAGRRPQLLAETLESFDRGLFQFFSIRRIILNIDPIFGSEEEERSCIEIVRRYDREAIVRSPEAPGFCAAVVNNWKATEADTVLHLEDDWLLRVQISPGDIASFSTDPAVGQISFNAAEKYWDSQRKGIVAYRRRHYRLFGRDLLLNRRIPMFTTSPSFLRGTFARGAAARMDLSYDPEKQFYSNVNPNLEAFVRGYKNIVLGNGPNYPVVDIGRAWRKEQGIVKSVRNAVSTWSTAGNRAPD